MKIAVISIDPGKDGAIVVIGPGEKLLAGNKTRDLIIGKNYSIPLMLDAVKDLLLVGQKHGDVTAIIEKAIPFMRKPKEGDKGKGMGATSAFSMGYGLGLWHSIFTILEIPWEEVSPQKWQEGIPNRPKGNRKALKAHLVAEAMKRSPGIGKHEGRCDAYLIGVYRMRQLVGGSQ